MSDTWEVAGEEPDEWSVTATAPINRRGLGERLRENFTDAIQRSAIGQLSRQLEPRPGDSLMDTVVGKVWVDKGSGIDRFLDDKLGPDRGFLPGVVKGSDPVYKAERQRRQDAAATAAADPFYGVEGGLPAKAAAGAATLAGQLGGAAVSPENWVAPGKTVLGRMAGNAGVAAGTDVLLQGGDIGTGVQDQWEPVQTVLAGAAGGGLSLAGDAAAHGVRAGARALGEALLPNDVLDVGVGRTADIPAARTSPRAPAATAGASEWNVVDERAAPRPANDWQVARTAPVEHAATARSGAPSPAEEVFGPPAPAARAHSASVDDVWGRLVQQESGGDQAAVSPKGAFGRAQLMPDTAAEVAARLGDPSLAEKARTDPAVNERLGRAYYQEQLDAFGGDHMLAAAAYNAGPGRVREWLHTIGDPNVIGREAWAQRIPIGETRNYVQRVAGDAAPAQPRPPEQLSDAEVGPQPDAARTTPSGELVDLGRSSAAEQSPGVRTGDLWRMSPDELKALHEEASASDFDKLVKAFGSAEEAKAFDRLERRRHRSDPRASDEAAAEFDRKYGNLTPEQERLVYGIGEEDRAQPDDVLDMLRHQHDVSDTSEGWLVDDIGRAIRSVPDVERLLKVPEGRGDIQAQKAYVTLQRSVQELQRRGYDTERLNTQVIGSLVDAGYGKRSDVAEVVGSFLRDLKAAAPAPDAMRSEAALPKAAQRALPAPLSATERGRAEPWAVASTQRALPSPDRVEPVDMTDRALDALRTGGRVKPDRGQSLMEYLARRGGIADTGGELRAMDAELWHRGRPFMPRLLRDEGHTVGDAAVAAQEAGYLRERFGDADNRATPQELIDAIHDELRGRPRYGRQDPDGEALAAHVRDLDEVLGHLGIDPAKHSNAELRTAVDEFFARPDPEARRFAMKTGPAAAARRLGLRPGGQPTGPRDAPAFRPIPAAQAQPFTGRSVSALATRLRKALGITHRQGRVQTPKALGEYDVRSAVVRTRMVHELDVLAHEATHALEFKAGPALKDALRAHEAELKPMAYQGAAPGVLREEGFAEFGRLYVTNPDVAQREAPKFYEAFEDALFQDAPDVLRDLKDVQGAYQQLLMASSVDVAAGSIAHTGRPGPLERIRGALADRGLGGAMTDLADHAYTAFVDDLHPLAMAVRQLQEIYAANHGGQRLDLNVAKNPYALARLAREAYAAGHLDLMEGVVPYHGTDPQGPSLAQALEHALGEKAFGKWSKKDLARFDAYLVARRMTHEWDRYAAGDLQRPPDRYSKAFHEQVIADSESANPKWPDAAGMVYGWLDGLWTKEHEAGLITRETFENGRTAHPDYVPLMRDVSDKRAPGGRNRPSGAMQHAGGAKQFRGSTRDVISPLSSMMRRAYELNALIKRNEIIRTLDDLAQAAGPGGGAIVERLPAHEIEAINVDAVEALRKAAETAGLPERDLTTLVNAAETMLGDETQATIFRHRDMSPAKGEAVVFAWRDGKKTPLLLADGEFGQDMFTAISGMNREMSNILVDTMSAGTQLLRHGVTLSPEFMSANIIRDQLATWINTDVGLIPGYHFAKGVVEQVRQGPMAQRYAAAGGMRGGMNTSALRKPFPHDDKAAQAQLQHLRKKGYRIRTYHPLHLRGLAALTDLSETGTRLGVMGLAFKQAKKRGLDDYEAMLEAAYTSRDYLDFGRHGSKMLTAVRTVTFLNAAIQGLDKTARVLTAGGNLRQVLAPLGAGAPRTPAERRAQAHAYKALAKIGALAAFGGALRVLYADDPEYEEIGDQLRATHWFFKAGGKWIGIPKPFELAEPSNIVERAFEMKVLKDPKAPERFLSDFAATMAPPHDIPALAVPYQIAANRDHLGKPIVPDHLRGKVDPELQFNAYTSQLGKAIGAALHVSPAIVDYVITGFGGSLGRYALQGTNLVAEGVAGKPRTATGPEDAFVSRRFVRDVTRGSTSQKEFWDLVSQSGGDLVQAEGTFRLLMKGGDDAKATAYLNKLSPDARAYVQAKVFSKGGTANAHPIVRAQQALSVIGDVRRDVRDGSLATMGGSPIELTPQQRREADDALSRLGMAEMRDALVSGGVKGWAQREPMSRGDVMDQLKAISPQTEEKLRKTMGEQYVMPAGLAGPIWRAIQSDLAAPADPALLARKMAAKRLSSTDRTAKREEAIRLLQARGALP